MALHEAKAPAPGPGALSSLLTKLWGFASQNGRFLPFLQPLPLSLLLLAVPASDASVPTDPSSTTSTGGTDNSLEVIRRFAETYAQRTGTYFCSDPGVTAVVLEGLARNKDELGGALCPCRHYEDKKAEVAQAFWNCPCVPMRERKECHCMLFLTEDNPFRGDQQTISLAEVKALTSG